VALIRGLAPRAVTQPLGPARPATSDAPARPGDTYARPVLPRRPAPARPGADDPAARSRFDAALRLAREVLAYVSPRLALADVALAATGLPGPRRPWPEVEPALAPGAERAGIGAPLRPWLPLLARLFWADLGATRHAHQAVVQWKRARELGEAAEKVDGLLAQAPPPSHPALLRAVDVPHLRAAVYPLSHLHLRFRGVPHLSALFPPPPACPGDARAFP
jgi:hypothetical protein